MPTPFTGILSAARFAKGLNISEIARRAALPRGRAYQLFAGRVLPRDDELSRLLDAVGVPPAHLTAPLIQSYGAHLFPVGSSLLPIILGTGTAVPVTKTSIANCELLVHRIAFTSDASDAAGFFKEISQQHKTKIIKSADYQTSLKLVSDLVVQCKPRWRSQRFARLEFNPTRADQLAVTVALFPFLDIQSARVSRIDVAVDAPVYLTDVQPLAIGNQKVAVYLGPAGVESVKVGAPRSQLSIRIYDKALEQRRWRPLATTMPLTRIEAEIRPKKLRLVEFHRIANP
ncbi:MAG: helix-turn-helix transcriptional regulator, partial [Pseudomonadota bacterium]